MGDIQGQKNIRFERDPRSCQKPSWSLDLLNRKSAAHRLELLIANTPGPYVIAMTSEWGSGKTFFLKSWEEDLHERKRPCVYFNAWETDHAGDPLLALTGCITESLKQQKFIAESKLKTLAKTASSIVTRSPKLVAKIALGAANHCTDGALDDAKDILADSFEMGTALFLENEKKRESFTNQLQKIAQSVAEKIQKTSEDPVNNSPKFPLFVMIDELDRCRPAYVIELLESIKHLFNVPGVVFLLAIDGEQLFSALEHYYGLKASKEHDARQDYLRKFIDIFWQLPRPDNFEFLYASLIEKDVSIPNSWPNLTDEEFLRYGNFDEKKYMYEKKSFYGALARAASIKNKKLREYIQLIEKYNLISKMYDLNIRESIIIFDVLLNRSSEISLEALPKSILKKTYPRANLSRYRVDAEKGILSEIYTAICVNAYDHAVPDVNDSWEAPRDDTIIYNIVATMLNKPFLGEELAKSVEQKINFLDEFHFGEKVDS